jgi:hypothetical protein
VGSIALLFLFLVRTFYFAFFELSWQGQTPGKHRTRIRVVDARGGPLAAEAAFVFDSAQLDIYGVYELQVLEQVLRDTSTPHHLEAMTAVAQKIRQKIGWEGTAPAGPERFLRDFYAALRARLEHRMLLGRRRASKHDQE